METSRGLGQAVKALRKLNGLTQAQLASRCGLERTSICNIERGNQILTERTINAIAQAMGYRVKVKFEKL